MWGFVGLSREYLIMEYYDDFQADTQHAIQDQDGEQQFQYDFPTQVSKQMLQDIIAIVFITFSEVLLTANSLLLTS